jgi:hypothetical protein
MKHILTYTQHNESFKDKRKELKLLNNKLKKYTYKDQEYSEIKNKIKNIEDDIAHNYEKGNTYAVGDVVMIRYWQTGDLTPVKIIKIKSKNSYVVDFSIEGSLFRNAPETSIKSTDIVGMYRSNDSPALQADLGVRQTDKISNDLVINGYPKTI